MYKPPQPTDPPSSSPHNAEPPHAFVPLILQHIQDPSNDSSTDDLVNDEAAIPFSLCSDTAVHKARQPRRADAFLSDSDTAYIPNDRELLIQEFCAFSDSVKDLSIVSSVSLKEFPNVLEED